MHSSSDIENENIFKKVVETRFSARTEQKKTHLGLGVNSGPVSEQEFSYLQTARPSAQMEGRLTTHRRLLHRGTAL